MTPRNFKTTPNIREIIPAERVQEALRELTSFLLTRFEREKDDFALVGIHTRGAVIARLLAGRLQKDHGMDVPVGELDITLYRDDFSTSGVHPIVGETRIGFDVNDKHIVLIDDVLFTGRTIRAAMDEIMDFGRPHSISLVVLVDRGHRELPIQADFAPIKLATKRTESVNLNLDETDQKQQIVIYEATE
jgi:pyrimidine operon attenuation protein / uracil phosphoribosyltransferase